MKEVIRELLKQGYDEDRIFIYCMNMGIGPVSRYELSWAIHKIIKGVEGARRITA